jgi:hypothetical protein
MDENIPTQSPQPIATPVPVQFSKKNNLVVILLTVLLLVSFSISIFLFLQVQTLTKQLAQSQVVTPIPTLDPTADWKTYTNSEKGFLFKYPNTWTAGNPAPEDANAIVNITADEKIGDGVEPVVYSVRVSKSDKLSVQKYTDLQEVKELSNGFTVSKTTQEFSRSGMLTYLFTKDRENFIKLSLDPFTSEVSATSPKFPKQDIYLSTFIQILFTFKFTGNSVSSIPQPISDLFTQINNNFKLNLVPIAEDRFYSPSGTIAKKSWKLDFTNANIGKSLTSFLLTKLRSNSEGGDVGGGGINGYENDLIKCFRSYGYRSGGPTNWSDPFDYLSCAEK